jgi:hypothetical protein
MSNLSAFIKPAYTERKIEVIVGDRFLDENGNPVPIVLKSLTQEQMNAIAKRSMRQKVVGGRTVTDIDATENLSRCLIASIISPDLTDKELCNAYGVEDPVLLPPKMFLVDEFEKVAKAFAKLNGLKEDDGSIRIAGEVTKN